MPTTPNSLINISARHQVYLEGLKTSQQKKIDPFLRKLDKEIRDQLTKRDITQYTRKRFENFLNLLNRNMAVINGEFLKELRFSIKELAEYEAGFEIRSLNQVIDTEFTLPSVSQLNTAVFTKPLSVKALDGGGLLRPYLKSFNRTTISLINNEIRDGYYQGKTLNQILQSVRGTRANRFTDGVISNVKRRAEGMVRTSLQHAAEQSRQAVWEQNKRVVKGVRWTSTLDSKTSPVCRDLDGQVFDLDKGPRPPAHINCRSRTTAALSDKYKFLSKGATRSARDPSGKVVSVPAKQTYYQWLKNQPAKFQDSVIGPNRGKLLRNGKISTKRFAELQLDKNFNPLTLEEMRKLEPLAFENANITG